MADDKKNSSDPYAEFRVSSPLAGGAGGYTDPYAQFRVGGKTPAATPGAETTYTQQLKGFGRDAEATGKQMWGAFKQWVQEPLISHLNTTGVSRFGSLAAPAIALGTTFGAKSLPPIFDPKYAVTHHGWLYRALTPDAIRVHEPEHPEGPDTTGWGRRAAYAADILAGGNPFKAAGESAAGHTGEAMWSALGVPFTAAATGELASKAAAPLLETAAEAGARIPIFKENPFLYSTEVGGPVEKRAQQNLINLTHGFKTDDGAFMSGPGSAAEEMVPYYRKAANDIMREWGVKPEDLPSLTAGGDFEFRHPVRSLREMRPGEYRWQKGMDFQRALFGRVANEFSTRFESLISAYGNRPATTEGLSEYLDSLVSPDEAKTTSGSMLRNRVDEAIARIKNGGINNIAEADNLRKEFANTANKQYDAIRRGDVGADLNAWDADRRIANAIRSYEYDSLARESGINVEDLRDFQRQHAQAVRMKFEHDSDLLSRQLGQAGHSTQRVMQTIGGQSQERYPDVRRSVLSAIRRGPIGESNVFTREMVSPISRAGEYPEFNIGPETVTVIHHGPQPQLPPITGPFNVRTPGMPTDIPGGGVGPEGPYQTGGGVRDVFTPETTGGVFPNREVLSSPTRIPGADERLPERYAYHRNPFFVTDYEGSGKFGEEPAMPETKAAYVSIDNPEQARAALRGYRRFENTKAFENLDPADQARFREERRHLEAFAKQGEVGRGPSRTEVRVERKTEYKPGKKPEGIRYKRPRKIPAIVPHVVGHAYARTLPGLTYERK